MKCSESAPRSETTKKLVQMTPRHDEYSVAETTGGLSVAFTVMCIVDLFGVFPVITLPKSVISCGIYGIPMCLAVLGLQLYTAALLGRSWLLANEIKPIIKQQTRSPYAAVAELAFGDLARRLVIFLIDVTAFGSGIPNFILAAQSLQIFWWKISDGNIAISYCVWMVLLILLLCPVMWLGSPKDMKPLALTSVCIVCTVAVATWTCIVMDNETPLNMGNILEYQPRFEDFLIAYGILAFQFDIHPMLLTIQVDMRDSRKVNKAVLGGFCVTGLMFAMTTLLVASRYGLNITNNILQTIPPSIPLFIVALLVTLQLCLSSVVGNSALFQHIEDFLKIPKSFCLQRCLVRSGIIALALFLGETVPRFDLVMGLVGSTLTGPLMFILPPLLFLKLCYLKSIKDLNDATGKYKKLEDPSDTQRLSKQNGSSTYTKYKTFSRTYSDQDLEDEYAVHWYDILIAVVVMTMGVLATIVATYSSWSKSIAYAEYSPPCLVNATIAARAFVENQFAAT